MLPMSVSHWIIPSVLVSPALMVIVAEEISTSEAVSSMRLLVLMEMLPEGSIETTGPLA